MDGYHLLEIVENLVEYVLCNTKFDKGYVRERLAEMGWTDFDLAWFNIDWMFKEE